MFSIVYIILLSRQCTFLKFTVSELFWMDLLIGYPLNVGIWFFKVLVVSKQDFPCFTLSLNHNSNEKWNMIWYYSSAWVLFSLLDLSLWLVLLYLYVWIKVYLKCILMLASRFFHANISRGISPRMNWVYLPTVWFIFD